MTSPVVCVSVSVFLSLFLFVFAIMAGVPRLENGAVVCDTCV